MDLEFVVIGEGDTTLIIETGIGNSFYSWLDIAEELKSDFTIVLYHRAGYGKSKVSNEPRHVRAIAEELDLLVRQLDIQKPFVLAGHSFGGLCVQQYTRMFPEKVKGLVLIDSTSPDYYRIYDLDLPVMWSYISEEKMIQSNIQSSKKSSIELETEMEAAIHDAEKTLPKHAFNDYKTFITSPDLFHTIAREFQNWPRDSEIINASGDFPAIPLTVIARDQAVSAQPFIDHGIPQTEAHLHEKVWRELQEELAMLNKTAGLVIAEGSDHEIHKDRPDIIIEILLKYI
ncbi:alpha/beta fold hydrolase [Bacillus salacetis]|uniref:Alpha/beta fold hydrolase n=1 Tax=Bacillus salacetis TaxID=2315464 RepID=A0A3A1QVB6_9BACI|nr:alpha/beta fold hydrolase [Bacillus salacetis]RIW32013.1 alpha/beta fold hydrolase [Bacillus salacetis]